ncbi:hypothetical protein QF032_006030 [Streptomyces achromogenes]|uniref:Secreted protein n=1 Tax=Streptomyces achromogenes TaxID=67255 RepID=A0ABU0Q8N5_STRAH|nr:hypothetical protein [Streptomyces achromogenes]MDQ0687032.1 hypothetical protein [Streptomyces achromogenes]MDQ0834186.1 hypothetical protein [Streptomyces achromogenes]
MAKRTRANMLTGFAVLSAAGLALGAALAAPAHAAAPKPPGFLSAANLPPHPTSTWTAGRITPGVSPEGELDRCLSSALGDGRNSWHRDFRTDLDASARQISVKHATVSAAKSRYARIDKDIKSCPVRIERADPEVEATLKDYGKVNVEEGAHVYGLHTETSWGASDIRLLAVGRDGTTVTVVDWGQMGDFDDAPVKAFKKTTVTAVNKLH